MARPLRIEYPGAWYHVMNRGANRERIFSGSGDYGLFIDVLKEACGLFNVYISAYCLMSNHYHLVVHTPEGNLSRFMRHVNGVYTQRYNIKHKRDGALFRGRYKAILIQAEEYLTHIVKYIHQNPLKAKMINDLTHYKWSSHPFYLKGKSDGEWLDINNLLACFSNRKKKAISLSRELSGLSFSEIAKRYKIKSYKTIASSDFRLKERMKKNRKIKKQYAALRKACSQGEI